MMEQLDLFGNAYTPAPKPAAPKKKAAKAVPPPVEPSVVAEPNPEVFNDGRISVKVKAKVVAEPVTAKPAEPIPAREPKPAAAKGKRGRKSLKELDAEVDLIDVPDDATLQQKLYYSISEVAGWFRVNTSLIRYWENEFDILKPRKNRKGDRLFRVEDIKNLQLIYYLLRQRKFSIEGARNYLKQHKQQADAQMQVVASLTKFRAFLLELRANLDA
jgi:DNA-binding transcriptional MerR regulator